MNSKELLIDLSNGISLSGLEENASNIISEAFNEHVDEIKEDKLGNLMCIKRGTNNKNGIKIMLAAHMDEIGLMVKDIDKDGFIRFTNIGGVDPRTLMAAEVIVHGKENFYGVVGSKPIHFQTDEEKKNALDKDEIIIDIGFEKEKVEELVSIGDYISIKREAKEINNNIITGKALDDKAGVACMYDCLMELKKLKHEADVYFVSTVQEEVGVRGAGVSTYSINPDIGIALDVGFGSTPELPKEYAIDLGKGPAITIGANVHPKLREKLVSVASEYNIPYQYEVDPGLTGTDGRAMIITRAGVPTLVISLPLRYMHTSVETIDFKDIQNSGKLIARFISAITHENLEELLCY